MDLLLENYLKHEDKKSTNVRSKNGRPVPREIRMLRGALGLLSRVSTRLAASWALKLWGTPLRNAPSATETEALASGSRFTLETPVGPLQAWSWGSGPAVLLLHGWAGRGGKSRR